MYKVNYRYYCHCPDLDFLQLPETVEGLLLKDEEMVEFSK
jgi:hypothetical protein